MDENSSMIPIFSNERDLSVLLNFVAGIVVLENDRLPQLICLKCLLKVEEAQSTKNQCIESDRILRLTLKAKTEKLSQNPEVDEDGEFQDFPDFADNDTDSDFKIDSEDEEELISETKSKTKRIRPSRAVKKPHKPHKKHTRVPDVKTLKCPRCKKELKNKYNLKSHLQNCMSKGVVKEKIPPKCYTCHEEFKTLNALLNHMTVHMKDGVYKCSVPDCDRIPVVNALNFYYHLESHVKPLNKTCPYCQKLFIDRAVYMQHINKHKR